MDKESKVITKQSLLDVAIQQCGDATAVFNLAVLNGLSVTDDLKVGQIIESNEVVDVDVEKYYRLRNIKPATAFSDADKVLTAKNEGIGYWAIEVDFIVQ